MDWTKNLQNAIDYIEENLKNEIDPSEVANIAVSSPSNFQRVFSILCNYTLGEYIRNRRLSLAGNDLLCTDQKVIDIAFKYGYDSPESFTRAFVRFHGINPSHAKKYGGKLKSFSKISVKLSLDGGSVMDYQIKKLDEFQIISKKKYVPVEIEKSQQEIPKFWAESRINGDLQKVCDYARNDEMFKGSILGICFENSDKKDEYPYGIGAHYNGENINDDFEVDSIKPTTWAIFKCVGPMPTAIHRELKIIYSEFFPSSDYKPDGNYYLEVYPDGDTSSDDYECEIWISVDKN